LASGELADARARLLTELDEIDDFGGAGPPPVEAAKQPHRLRHGELFRELGLLEGDSEQLSKRPVVASPAPPQDDNLASVGRGQAGEAGGRRACQVEPRRPLRPLRPLRPFGYPPQRRAHTSRTVSLTRSHSSGCVNSR